ncbi:hypothetical protein [Frankia sp. CcI49]|uniref:hypothetical protein n=1 Tax=Frankia sp. CcI49 TaxID=1745382 RepID=UPI0010543A19|nr:hypothetical protein [Frankia sp. CcI49]
MADVVRVEMSPTWLRDLTPNVERFHRQTLGPAILADARRAVPVDTGDLYRDLGAEAHGLELRVGPRGATDYGELVERGTSRTRAQPYLRPALMRRRTP